MPLDGTNIFYDCSNPSSARKGTAFFWDLPIVAHYTFIFWIDF
jgi:hypothetical protein